MEGTICISESALLQLHEWLEQKTKQAEKEAFNSEESFFDGKKVAYQEVVYKLLELDIVKPKIKNKQ